MDHKDVSLEVLVATLLDIDGTQPDHSNFYVTGQGIGGTASAFCNIHWTEIK